MLTPLPGLSVRAVMPVGKVRLVDPARPPKVGVPMPETVSVPLW